MDEQTELLREIRDLLFVMAGPTIAERDRTARDAIVSIVGKSAPKGQAVLLMDGTRSKAAIARETGVDAGDLSRLCKALKADGLVSNDEKPKLKIKLPLDFFERERKNGR